MLIDLLQVRLAQEICQFENFSELESHLVTELLNSLANYGLLPSIPQAEERGETVLNFFIGRF